MREILFRGKSTDNGEWVYGYYVPVCFGRFPCKPAIVPEPDGKWEPTEVKKETVGQFTGLTDKNGKKIFERDIVDSLEFYGEVYYDHDGCFDLRDNTSELGGDFIGSYNSHKVVGNIHDNPELMEAEQ
jgi:hypothetical protein